VSAQLEAEGSEAQISVESVGRRFTALRADLGDRAAVNDLARHVLRNAPAIDILVNNAGTIERAPAVDHDADIWDRVLEVNLNAPFFLARLIGRQMIERGRGKIIFTASMLSFQGGVLVPSYTAAKSAVVGLTKTLAKEWGRYNVNVNAVGFGLIETRLVQPLNGDNPNLQMHGHEIRLGVQPTMLESVKNACPLGRIGTPEEAAGAVLFFCSPLSDYVTGEVLICGGGMHF